MENDYRKFHESFLKSIKDEGFLHEDHIHPVVLIWTNFESNENKEKFLEFLKKQDEEFSAEMEKYLNGFKLEEEIIPIYFPFHAETDEEYEGLFQFFSELKQYLKVHVYSILSEIAFTDDDLEDLGENEDSLDYYPSIFSESESGECFMSVLNYKDFSINEEYSGDYDINNDTVKSLRLPIF
jgi:hypothetical protein